MGCGTLTQQHADSRQGRRRGQRRQKEPCLCCTPSEVWGGGCCRHPPLLGAQGQRRCSGRTPDLWNADLSGGGSYRFISLPAVPAPVHMQLSPSQSLCQPCVLFICSLRPKPATRTECF